MVSTKVDITAEEPEEGEIVLDPGNDISIKPDEPQNRLQAQLAFYCVHAGEDLAPSGE